MIDRNSQRLQDVLTWLKATAARGACLRIDSRLIEPGDVFVALKGAHSDGMSYAGVVAARGASCILTEKRDQMQPQPLAVYQFEGLAEYLGNIASAFYGNPSDRMMGVAITGTNGKTSTSHWVCALLDAMHQPCAAIGTIGCFYAGQQLPSPSLTTPDAASTQALLSTLEKKGAKAFAIEASSIGLVQGRLDGTKFHTAVFTNLTRDHLDYHGTMQDYEAAKATLFDWPRLKCAVINADDEAGLRMIEHAHRRGLRTIAYSLGTPQVPVGVQLLRADNIASGPAGMRFDLCFDGVVYSIAARVLGRFNISNLLAVAGVAFSLGLAPKTVCEKLETLVAPPGRLQMVQAQNAPLQVVDYAHTPDALEKALEALREIAQARNGALWVVFGAGGDRDAGKRPVMGATAARLADHVVVTSDNPRTEDPESIVRAVASGAVTARDLHVYVDRREAIVETVCMAKEHDVVLIAGKGHEDYQEINGVRHHFSDVEVAREATNERRVRESMK